MTFNPAKLMQRTESETITEFTLRKIRAEFMEEAACIVEAEAVSADDPADATDISYNLALTHAAEAIRKSGYGR